MNSFTNLLATGQGASRMSTLSSHCPLSPRRYLTTFIYIYIHKTLETFFLSIIHSCFSVGSSITLPKHLDCAWGRKGLINEFFGSLKSGMTVCDSVKPFKFLRRRASLNSVGPGVNEYSSACYRQNCWTVIVQRELYVRCWHKTSKRHHGQLDTPMRISARYKWLWRQCHLGCHRQKYST